jgi:hypothetical protein
MKEMNRVSVVKTKRKTNSLKCQKNKFITKQNKTMPNKTKQYTNRK